MAKKRVHEIAKELKSHGIELDNKEVVAELLALGYDVKSHSSSLEDDQANAAIQRIIDSRKPKAAPAPVAAKGFVVRRRVGAPSTEPEAKAAPEPEPVAEPAPKASPPVEVAPPATPAPPPPPAGVASAEPVRSSPPVAKPAPPVSTPPPAPPVTVPLPIAAQTPKPTSRPLAQGQGLAGAPVAAARPTSEPRQMRPTPTQAVVISRPLVQVRRVTPTSAAHKNIPMAPGKKAIGEVREFKVVPDHLGRGRELVDVTKNKADRGKKRTSEKESTFSKQEMADLVWGRVTIPLRGKKKKPTKK